MISTEVLNHVIIFHDKSILNITEKAAKAIDMALDGGSTHLRINGNLYSKGTIAKIMMIEDYYHEYPDQKPKELVDVHELMLQQGITQEPKGIEGVVKHAKTSKALQEIMKGFLKYGKRTHPIYLAMEARLKTHGTS